MKDEEIKINKDYGKYIIMVLLVVLIGTNVWLTNSIINMHGITMQFISDVFYSASIGQATEQDVSEEELGIE